MSMANVTGYGQFKIGGSSEDEVRESAWRISSWVAENLDDVDVEFEFIDWWEANNG